MSIKINRLEHAFTEEISKIIHEEVNDKSIGFVSITGASITNDLSFAKIYFTSMGADKDVAIKSLNKASGFIKTLLASRVDIRKMPELKFCYDDSIEYGERIDKIIDELDNNK